MVSIKCMRACVCICVVKNNWSVVIWIMALVISKPKPHSRHPRYRWTISHRACCSCICVYSACMDMGWCDTCGLCGALYIDHSLVHNMWTHYYRQSTENIFYITKYIHMGILMFTVYEKVFIGDVMCNSLFMRCCCIIYLWEYRNGSWENWANK